MKTGKLFFGGKHVGDVTGTSVVISAPPYGALHETGFMTGVSRTDVQVTFQLELSEDPMPGLRKLCVDVVTRYFGERLRDYELHVDDTTEHTWATAWPISMRRSSLLVRLVPRGQKRSLGNMSFNYYHRDEATLGRVRTRLLARLEKYCLKILPRLRTPEQLAASAARRAAELAARPKRVAQASAEADAAFKELEKNL